MKKYLIIMAALALAIVAALVVVRQGDATALNVNEVASDPAAFSGSITVTGIMGGISRQDPTVFGIMDKKELQCTTPNCNKVLIPVKYQGQMPVIGDEVRVSGRFVTVADGWLFTADTLKVVRNHRIGG